MDGFMTKCKPLIGELYMWSMSWKIIKPTVNTTYSWASSMISNNEMWIEMVRSKKLIYKFKYEENHDVDAVLFNLAMISHNYCDSKKTTIMKNKWSNKKRKRTKQRCWWKSWYLHYDSSTTKKHQKHRRRQHIEKKSMRKVKGNGKKGKKNCPRKE